MSCLYLAREMGQPAPDFGSFVVQSKLPEHATPGSQVAPAMVHASPTAWPCWGLQMGAPVGADGSRHTGPPQVANHFRPVPASPIVGHGGNVVVHWPFTHAPAAHELEPSGHSLQMAGTAHSP